MSKGLETLIDSIAYELRAKSDFPGRWCKDFTEECIGKLKDYAEKKTDCGKKCEYCDKFRWIIDRAKYYAEKTGLNWEDILDSWEKDRDYWYMNYYQDSNQPEIKTDKVRIFDTQTDMLKAIDEKKFRCPCCGGVSTDPYECNSGLPMDKRKICDWKIYGLFGDIGKGVYVFCKDIIKGQYIFMPLSWETDKDRKEAESLREKIQRRINKGKKKVSK
jgi:hypothetical protein